MSQIICTLIHGLCANGFFSACGSLNGWFVAQLFQIFPSNSPTGGTVGAVRSTLRRGQWTEHNCVDVMCCSWTGEPGFPQLTGSPLGLESALEKRKTLLYKICLKIKVHLTSSSEHMGS